MLLCLSLAKANEIILKVNSFADKYIPLLGAILAMCKLRCDWMPAELAPPLNCLHPNWALISSHTRPTATTMVRISGSHILLQDSSLHPSSLALGYSGSRAKSTRSAAKLPMPDLPRRVVSPNTRFVFRGSWWWVRFYLWMAAVTFPFESAFWFRTHAGILRYIIAFQPSIYQRHLFVNLKYHSYTSIRKLSRAALVESNHGSLCGKFHPEDQHASVCYAIRCASVGSYCHNASIP